MKNHKKLLSGLKSNHRNIIYFENDDNVTCRYTKGTRRKHLFGKLQSALSQVETQQLGQLQPSKKVLTVGMEKHSDIIS